MIHIVPTILDKQHPLGVKAIRSVDDLVQTVTQHSQIYGSRFCPFFAALPSGIRMERLVAIQGRDRLVIKTDFSAQPEEIELNLAHHSRYIGRYLSEGRLFYDEYGLEVPANLSAMQRFS